MIIAHEHLQNHGGFQVLEQEGCDHLLSLNHKVVIPKAPGFCLEVLTFFLFKGNFIYFYYFMCTGVLFACISVHHTYVWCLWIPEEDTEFSGISITDGWGCSVGAGIRNPVLWKSNQCLPK